MMVKIQVLAPSTTWKMGYRGRPEAAARCRSKAGGVSRCPFLLGEWRIGLLPRLGQRAEGKVLGGRGHHREDGGVRAHPWPEGTVSSFGARLRRQFLHNVAHSRLLAFQINYSPYSGEVVSEISQPKRRCQLTRQTPEHVSVSKPTS